MMVLEKVMGKAMDWWWGTPKMDTFSEYGCEFRIDFNKVNGIMTIEQAFLWLGLKLSKKMG